MIVAALAGLVMAATSAPAEHRAVEDPRRAGFVAGIAHQCTPGSRREDLVARARATAQDIAARQGSAAAFDYAAAFGHGIASAALSVFGDLAIIGPEDCARYLGDFEAASETAKPGLAPAQGDRRAP